MENQHSYTSSFRKFILYISGLVLCFLLVGWTFSFGFEKQIIFKSEISGASKVNRILHVSNEKEIPIFGSSRAQGSYVPSILGAQYYNYGIDGTGADMWLFFLEKELEKKKESPVIINFDYSGISKGAGDIGDLIPNSIATKKLMNDKYKFYYYLPFIKYFGHYESYMKYYLNSKMNLTKHIDNGGSFEKNTLAQEKFDELVAKRLKSDGIFSSDTILIDRLDNVVRKSNRLIIFIVAPYHSSYISSFNDLDVVHRFLEDLNKIENIQVLDYSEVDYSDDFFMNTTHLNYSGAVKFSEELALELKSITE